jgi:putative copper export protein
LIEILAFARAMHVAGCILLFGALMFRTTMAPAACNGAPPDAARRLEHRFEHLCIASFALSIAAALVWLPLQAAVMSGATTAGEVAHATAVALRHTFFGQVFVARMALLLGAGLCLSSRFGALRQRAMAIGAVLAGGAVLLQAAAGHAVAFEGIDRYAALSVQAVHLAAAGAWLGSLLPLALTLLILPPAHAARAAVRFSPLGVASAAAIAATAWFNWETYIGELPPLATAYGRWALVKSALLLLMLAFAVVNRFGFTPKLVAPDGAKAARRMRLSIVLETCVGFAIVLVAGMLVNTIPASHALRPDPASLHRHSE